MSTSVDLQGMFSYSFLLSLVFLILFIICLLLVAISYMEPKKKTKPITIVKPLNVSDIKSKYLNEINALLANINNGQINIRHAYQKLSKLIRNFVYEVTGIKVQNCTLSDIRSLNMPFLVTLVEEYYHPEFAEDSKGDIISSVTKTKEVVEKWK